MNKQVVFFVILLLGFLSGYQTETLMSTSNNSSVKTATFALGCFWGPDARFGILPGVIRTRVGYAGGEKENPTYYDLGNHIETVQIDYDPDKVTYQELLHVFWNSHKPVQQAVKRQYMSVIFFHNPRQQQLAEETKRAAEQQVGQQLYTELMPFDNFYRAEDYHQKWNLSRHNRLYQEVRNQFSTFEAFVNSTMAARINGFVSGYGSTEELESVISSYSLPQPAKDQLQEVVESKKGGVPEGCGL